MSSATRTTSCDLVEATTSKQCSVDESHQGKGLFYAILTAVVCPCHLPIVGVVLGGSAAGVFFHQHFWSIAAFLAVVTLFSFYKAVRLL